MAYQTVYRVTPNKGIDSIKEFTEPIPAVGPHELLVKVRSVSLNYRDIAIATGKYPEPLVDEVVPCCDMAGEVAQVGPGVSDFAVGDAITLPVSTESLYGQMSQFSHKQIFGGRRNGTLTEYMAVPAHATIKLPKASLTWGQWATLPGTATTVWNCFYGNKPLAPGDVVLVLGTGGVSITALLFAKKAGCTVIVTSSSDKKLEFVKREFGADHTINYNTHPEWSKEVIRLTNGHGADHVIENCGSGTIEQSILSTATGGVVSLVGFLSQLPKDQMPDVVMLAMQGGVVIRGIMAGSRDHLEKAVRFVGIHEIKIPIHKAFKFNREDILEAYRLVESGQHIGKVCINLE